MAWTAIRNQTLLAFFSLSAIAINAGLGGFAHLMAARKKLVTLALGLIMLGSVYYNGREVWMRRQTGGLGLTGMSERAALRGGRLRAGRSDDGFAVRLWLPA